MTVARRAALLAGILLASIALSGCSASFARSTLVVAVSAPKEAGGLTIFALRHGSGIGAPDAGEYEILYDGKTVYPPGGSGAEFSVDDEGAAVFVPYSLFVVGNGDYELRVRYDKKEMSSRFPVEKWVEYVFLHPVDRGSKVQVDVQLSRTTGGLPSDRVVAEGDLLLDLHYRGKDGKRDKLLSPTLKITTDATDTFTRVEIPRGRFTEGPGYYSLEPTFHNRQAKGNLWVPGDPSMSDRNPPVNWIYIAR